MDEEVPITYIPTLVHWSSNGPGQKLTKQLNRKVRRTELQQLLTDFLHTTAGGVTSQQDEATVTAGKSQSTSGQASGRGDDDVVQEVDDKAEDREHDDDQENDADADGQADE